jgi:putative SOS response-associated peptidase YedK
MCGRYNLNVTGPELLSAFDIDYDTEKFIDLGPRYNIYPTQVVPAVRHDSGERAACLLRWVSSRHGRRTLNTGTNNHRALY